MREEMKRTSRKKEGKREVPSASHEGMNRGVLLLRLHSGSALQRGVKSLKIQRGKQLDTFLFPLSSLPLLFSSLPSAHLLFFILFFSFLLIASSSLLFSLSISLSSPLLFSSPLSLPSSFFSLTSKPAGSLSTRAT